MPIVGYKLRVDGTTVTDMGRTLPEWVTGLAAGDHTLEVATYDEHGILVADADGNTWSEPVTVTIDKLDPLRMDCGRNDSVLTAGWIGDAAYLTSVSSTDTEVHAVDVTGLTNPPNATVLGTCRTFNSEAPTFVIPGHLPGKKYLLLATFNEKNEAHVLGNSIPSCFVNDVLATPIGDPSPYFDVYEEAGLKFHKAVQKSFLAQARADGTIKFKVNNSVNNDAADIRIFALERYEAAPVASFTAHLPADQTGYVAFADTSTGQPTSRIWDLGDGNTSRDERPVHQYAAAGNYTPSLVSTNENGDSQRVEQTITIPSRALLTATPASLSAGSVGDLYSVAIGATGGTGAITSEFVTEDADACEFTSLAGSKWLVERRGYRAGLDIIGNLLKGVLSVPKPGIVVRIGDSTSRGFLLTGEPAYNSPLTPAAVLAKNLPYSWTVVEQGVSGSTIAQCTAAYAAGAATYLGGNHLKKVVTIRTGINDVINGRTLAQMKVDYQALFDTIQSTTPGVHIVMHNLAVSGGMIGGPSETLINAINAWFVSTATGLTAIVDIAGSVRYGNGHNNRVWGDGGIHNTNIGYDGINSELLAPIVLALPNNGTGAQASTHRFKLKSIETLTGNAVTKDYSIVVSQ